jgi:hypothetical protein
MPEEQNRQGFWTTLPGILTGSAALITAIAGLILGLYQYGIFGSKQKTVGQSTEAKGTTQTLTPETRSNQEPPLSAPNQKEKRGDTVVVTAKDGKVTTLYADSFRLYGGGDQLSFHGGQSIPLNRIREIDVLRVDSVTDVKVQTTLVDDQLVEGSIGPEFVRGSNDLGSFELSVDQLKRIVFPR